MEVNNKQFKTSFIKVQYSILIIFLFTLFSWIFFSNKSHWIISKDYDEHEYDHISFYEIFYFNSLIYFTLGFSEILPKNKFLKLSTILIMIFSYVLMFLDF
jgi:hypothetical protein